MTMQKKSKRIKGTRRIGTKNKKDIFKLDERAIKDLEIDSLPQKERTSVLKEQEKLYTHRTRRLKKGKIKKMKNKPFHSSIIDTQPKIYKKRMKIRKKRVNKDKRLNKELNNHLDDGGSLKDVKAQKILNKINSNKRVSNTLYSKKIQIIKSTPVETGKGDIPSLLDFGITYLETRFITEFVKEYNEVKAALTAKIITKHMDKIEQERIINELLGNPNVAMALQAAIQDQIHRTLVTSDRTITQIAKMAFSDPLEMFKEDGTGAIKDIKDIPASLRCCISELTNTNIYEGRGEDRVVTGHLTKVKLHDSLKALTILLKDIREKANKVGTINFNQFNTYGPGGQNIKDRLKDLSDKELDVLVKLSNQGVESTLKTKALPAPEDIDVKDSSDDIIELARAKNLEDGTQLYALDDLKSIEQDNI